jgi:hypothetical protein
MLLQLADALGRRLEARIDLGQHKAVGLVETPAQQGLTDRTQAAADQGASASTKRAKSAWWSALAVATCSA